LTLPASPPPWTATSDWRGWWAVPGVTATPGSPVTAVSRRTDFLDIFVSDDAGRIMTSAWQPGRAWTGWSHVQGGLTAPGGWVTAASRSPDLLDVFVVGTDSQLYSAAWEPARGWAGWWPLNNAKGWSPGAAVPVACRSANLPSAKFVPYMSAGDPVARARFTVWLSA